jgi:hypothetical protein
MIKIINNVLNLEDCFSLYSGLINANIWDLNRHSLGREGGAFPGVTFMHDEQIVVNDQYWLGYFNCLFDRINAQLKQQHNFLLNRSIKRIALNAQNDNHYTEFHSDNPENTYSIVGFLTPQWAEDWGGELNIEGEIIKYNPGDFILFESSKLHKSQPIKKIPYWRTSINYVIKK